MLWTACQKFEITFRWGRYEIVCQSCTMIYFSFILLAIVDWMALFSLGVVLFSLDGVYFCMLIVQVERDERMSWNWNSDFLFRI